MGFQFSYVHLLVHSFVSLCKTSSIIEKVRKVGKVGKEGKVRQVVKVGKVGKVGKVEKEEKSHIWKTNISWPMLIVVPIPKKFCV